MVVRIFDKQLALTIAKVVLENYLCYLSLVLILNLNLIRLLVFLGLLLLAKLSHLCCYMEFTCFSKIKASGCLLLGNLCHQVDHLVLLRADEQDEELSIIKHTNLVE